MQEQGQERISSFKLQKFPHPVEPLCNWIIKWIKEINNDLEVAYPQSDSSSTWFLVELEFGNIGFWGSWKIMKTE